MEGFWKKFEEHQNKSRQGAAGKSVSFKIKKEEASSAGVRQIKAVIDEH